ncbi:hypothetical protein OEZ86_004716 [Tetradesmus obliquus]|nr:hypothetical protein OEZ86_004716 [Tetradesmus obliquus]
MGILFVSLFVFVSALRFPGSCVAVLLYIVVAVTAAPDNHVGTRIFISGFMLGPMWLAISIGAIVATIAKLMPTPEAHMAVLCVLGPLAVVPFAIVRVGTGHLYLWAMGMISALYVGMPIIAGYQLATVAQLWMLVVFVIIAALVAMFAGSFLSMLVLPSLASHKLEDEVSLALRQLGHHLTATTSHLFRAQAASAAELLPGHLQGIHPLLLQDSAPTALAPGLLETETLGQHAVHDVYVALMDWFERQSRPPAQQQKSAPSIMCGRRSGVSSESGSTIVKSTFYGADAAGLAAAVAAAAADSFVGWSDAEPDEYDMDSNEHRSSKCNSGELPRGLRLGSSKAAASFVAVQLKRAASGAAAAAAAAAAAGTGSRTAVGGLGAAGFDAPLKAAGSRKLRLAGSSSAGLAGSRSGRAVFAPVPRIADTRQLLAHAGLLLDAAAAEPQWLRGSERRFESSKWAGVIAAAQLLATRLSALDLVQQDHCALLEEAGAVSLTGDMTQLLQALYAAAAAALAMLSEQAGDRSSRAQGCRAALTVLQGPQWQQGRQQLMSMLEATLARYCTALHDASADTPFVMPKAHWVRQLMFFILATSSVMDAVDALAAAATAALTVPNRMQFAHLKVALTQELPAMLSSREAFVRQVKGRRFRAGLKYWLVLSCVMVATLALLHGVPTAYRYAPNFGYSAAAVGMSDRVESTVHKVICWTASAVVGATLGWALMASPVMANNAVALAAVICCFCFGVGCLSRSKNTLVILYTLMTVASVVLCQYTPSCCDETGSTMMAVVRGASVASASLFAVAFQNLVWPWYTSSWALEQLGLAYQEAAELLAGMVCELYIDAHALIDKQQQQQQQQGAAGRDSSGGSDHGGASSPLVLQGRLLKPLVQVKISLLLDTTTWSSGLYATPPVVLRMLAAMFDVADALGALQQATNIKVEAVSGSWDWTLVQMTRAWGGVMLGVLSLADALLEHATQLNNVSAAALLAKIQEVQHLRFEFFARSRELRRLLHMALVTDEALFEAHMPASQPLHLQGHLRFSAAVYAAGKVLDRMTTVARCALEAGGRN